MQTSHLKSLLYYFLVLFCLLFSGCTTYFSKSDFLDTPPELLAQNSRVVLLVSTDEKLKIAARLTHLNELDSSIYNGREYFFLEIFNDDDYVVLPDSMQITMFGRKPLWIREVESREFDDVLLLYNTMSYGYLIAFRLPSIFERKKMQIELNIESFKPAIFDFSFIVLESKL